MALRYSFDMDKDADMLDKAVKDVLKDGHRTADIMEEGKKKVSKIPCATENGLISLTMCAKHESAKRKGRQAARRGSGSVFLQKASNLLKSR